MRLSYAALVAALFLLTSQSAQAESAYDAADALLAAEPISAVGEPLSAPRLFASDVVSPLNPTFVGLVGPESLAYSGQPHLSAIDDQPSLEIAVAEIATSGAAQHKSKTTGHVDAVPEPSALAMGAVALMFFLFFFRRRRLS